MHIVVLKNGGSLERKNNLIVINVQHNLYLEFQCIIRQLLEVKEEMRSLHLKNLSVSSVSLSNF